jgi:hypothetical protein
MGALFPIAPKLGKLVRLLGSDRPGEVQATVEALRRTLASAGLTLHDLADAIENPPQPQPRPSNAEDELAPWQGLALRCLDTDAGRLSEKERKFCRDMCRWRKEPSEKQREWLAAIHRKLRYA